VLAAFREEIKKGGLDVPVVEVGCLGHCYAEPIAVIAKPGSPAICYARVNPVIAERLVNEYILGDNPCPEFVLAAFEPND
jgi:NADH-quinone oxidoreductase subunit F